MVHDIGTSAFEPVASVKPVDENERCGKVADHSVVRSRVFAVGSANPADQGSSVDRSLWWPYLRWQAALDHGVVHDIGQSASEPVARIKWVPATYGYPFRATDVWGWLLTQGGARRLRRDAPPWVTMPRQNPSPRRGTTRPRTGRAHDHCEKPIGNQ